jgi:hypothetical protein
MNKRVKKLWLKALRSGRFKQGVGQLCSREDDGMHHCCLGVLEELAVAARVIDSYDHFNGGLDKQVQIWAGINNYDPKLGPRKDSRSASWYNDHGRSFDFIANRIEKYL